MTALRNRSRESARKREPRNAAFLGAIAAATLALVTLDPTLAPIAAQAQDCPSDPVTFIIPFAAGSGTVQLARAVAAAITHAAKVTVEVDKEAGANGFIAAPDCTLC